MRKANYENVRVDGYTRVCLTAIAVLLTVLVIGLWADLTGPVREARAESKFRDSKAQKALTEGRWGTSSAPQQAIARAQQESNLKLDELIKLLKSGEIRVRVVGMEAPGGDNARKDDKK